MITGGRVCDRCYMPVSNNTCSTVTLANPYGSYATYDLCDGCMADFCKWVEPCPEVAEARRTPLERYAAKLKERTEVMSLDEAVGEVPEGILVAYPSGRYGMTTYDSDGMTIWGRDKLAYDKDGTIHIIKRGVDINNGVPGLMVWGHKVDYVPFMQNGRWGTVVNSEQLGRRLTEWKW